MRIGIIGGGNIGGTVGRLWHEAGHEIRFGTRHPGTLAPLIADLGEGASAGTAEQAAEFGGAILLAVPLKVVPDLATRIASNVEGKLLLDATNPYSHRDGALATEATAGGRASGMWTSQHFPSALVVKAFNTVYFQTLADQAHQEGDRLGIPIAGDNAAALETASLLIRDAGFEPVIVGALSRSHEFDAGTQAYNSGMSARELRRYFSVH